MIIRSSLAASLSAALLIPVAAMAQDIGPPAETVFDGDHLTIGVGGGYGPSYEGSDDYVFFPTPLVQGKLGGIAITPRPAGAALDFIPDAKDAKIGFSLGPVATYSANRARQIKDPVVRSAGKLKESLDVGASAGITAYRLLSQYDSLTLSADVKWNVNKAHRGMVIQPGIFYVTPLSRAAIVTLGISAKHVDDDYARYYYGVTPAQSLASGLPLYNAKGGWASIGANALAGYDLDGDLTNGGFALFALGSYARLMDDAKRNPYTAIRGSADQFVGALGLAYTF